MSDALHAWRGAPPRLPAAGAVVPGAEGADALSLVATAGLTLDGAGRVERWDPWSPGIALSWAQTTSAERPSLAASGLGLAFSSSRLEAPHGGELDFVSGPSSDATLVLVLRAPAQSASGDRGVWGTRTVAGVGPLGGWAVTLSNAAGKVQLKVHVRSGSSRRQVSAGAWDTDREHCVVVRKNAAGGSLSLRVDGAADNSGTGISWSSAGGNTYSIIGAQNDSSTLRSPMAGTIRALAAIPRRLSDAECADVEEWAEETFGLTL